MLGVRIANFGLLGAGLLSATPAAAADNPPEAPQPDPITPEAVEMAEDLLGLRFDEAERGLMLDGLRHSLGQFRQLRRIPLANSVPPALEFNPIPLGKAFPTRRRPFRTSPSGKVEQPAHLEDAAFLSVGQLGELIRTHRVTSEELTRMYLNRLKELGPKLLCVVTLAEGLALQQARQADREIAAGEYRGPLHGIPYGIKDLLATKGIPTTWGSGLYRDQVIEEDATVVTRLRDAGAVLLAKLSMGELAWGDEWFGGRTRNPWKPESGSDGSSAGSAAAAAAGLVGFALGTETQGSIVSPCSVCGATGLRPTYGRVSRAGAMALSWSMDKIGPICRTVEDCALVLHAICGPDGLDHTARDLPFNYTPTVDLRHLRIGYLKHEFASDRPGKENDQAALEKLAEMGATLVPVELPEYPIGAMSLVLSVEAAAAFEELTRTGKDDQLTRQGKDTWPNVFRAARFVPAVEYLQATRLRYLLIQDMERLMGTVDLCVAPTWGAHLTATNLTGHPCVVVPDGFGPEGTPTSIIFLGRLYDEAILLAVAKRYQDATGFHLHRPPLFAPSH